MENGEKAKRGKGETENHGTVSERFTLFLHLPFSPFALFAPFCISLFVLLVFPYSLKPTAFFYSYFPAFSGFFKPSRS